MRVPLPADHVVPQVAAAVGEVHPRDEPGERTGQKVDGERVTVHLGEERHDEAGEAYERAPVVLGTGPEEARGESDREHRVEDDEPP